MLDLDGHDLTLRQSHHRRGSSVGPERDGQWWVTCTTAGCQRILTRDQVTHDAWCATEADALALARWHAAGEHGPAPGPGGPLVPEQLDLFASPITGDAA